MSFWEDRLTKIVTDKKLKDLHPNKESNHSEKKLLLQEPIEIGIHNSLLKSNIKPETLFRMIDFQFFDIDRKTTLNTIEDLEIYAENTRSLLIYLNLNLLEINDPHTFLVASHVGRAVGIVDVLKKLHTLMRIDINILPKEIVVKYVGSTSLLYDRRGDVNERFYDVILEIAAYAKKHLEIARNLAKSSPIQKNAHVALLLAVEASYWLDELEKFNFDALHLDLRNISTFVVPRMILKAGKRGEF